MKLKLTINALTSLLIAAVLSSACGDVYDLNGFDWEPDLPPSDSVYNREIQILDLGGSNIPPSTQPLDGADPLYFSLERFSPIPIAYKTSDRWDVAFSGLYNTSITSNNGAERTFGYGSSAIGGIMVLEQPYSEVVDVPDDSEFEPLGNIGLAGMGDGFSGKGHVFYTFFDNIFQRDKLEGPNGYLYAHMMYCLSEDFVKAFPGEYGRNNERVTPRTILIRTAKGNYAKLETQSYYKGTTDPMAMVRGIGAIPYMTFRYMIIKGDEKRFGFVQRNRSMKINLTTGKKTFED